MQKMVWALSALWLLSGCLSLKAPEVKGVDKLHISELSTDMKMSFNVNVRNPNTYGVKIRRMNVELFMEDSLLSIISLKERQRISALSDFSLPFEVQPKMSQFPQLALFGINEIFSGSGSQKLKVKGEIVVSKFIFRKRYSFSYP